MDCRPTADLKNYYLAAPLTLHYTEGKLLHSHVFPLKNN